MSPGSRLQAELQTAYRLCLWSRLANRVLLFLEQGETRTPEMLYDLARTVPWIEHLGPGSTIAVDASCKRSRIDPQPICRAEGQRRHRRPDT